MKITDYAGRDWDIKDVKHCVGKGWEGILDRLIAQIEALGWDGCLHQVKEKFGGLRFYIGAASPEIFAAIDAAEIESFKTCEDCGAPGRERGMRDGRSWIRTLCDTCNQRDFDEAGQ
jgi:hypothetical protein